MKKSKVSFIIFVILYIILCLVGALVYFYYMPKLTVYNFDIGSSNINVSFSCPENFHAYYSTDDVSKSCIFTGLYNKFLMALSIENCEYNLEGYTLKQYADALEFSELPSSKRISQVYLDNSQNYTILKSEYAPLEDEQDGQISNYIIYTILHNNIFYSFKTEVLSKEMYEKYKSSIDSIMKTIEINDSNFSFDYNFNTNTEEYVPYYYSLLSNEDKKIYNDILKVFNKYETIEDGVKYSVESSKNIDRYLNILLAIAEDNAEYSNMIFYSFDYDEANNEFYAYLLYDDTNNIRNYKELMTNINSIADSIINNMPSNLTEYGKYEYLAKSICNLVEYDSTNENLVYGINDVFLNGKAQCTGYANAYQYLCNRAGLFCTQISGSSKDGEYGHVWNVIRLNDEYYYIDTTWMDADGEFDIFNYEDCKDTDYIEYLNNLYSDDYKVFTNTGKVSLKKVKNLCLF